MKVAVGRLRNCSACARIAGISSPPRAPRAQRCVKHVAFERG
jgi:hypothetical protein